MIDFDVLKEKGQNRFSHILTFFINWHNFAGIMCHHHHHSDEGLELTFIDDNTEAVLDVSVAVLLN